MFIIGGVAGAIGLVEYTAVNRWMNGMRVAPTMLSVKAFERYGEKAALAAITPTNDFYVTTKGSTPALKAEAWRLKIDGLVEHPLTLAYADVLALPRIDVELTLECIGNSIGGPLLGNARWTGTPLKPIIERARPTAEAKNVAIYGADGLSTGHPIERVWREENFMAYQMNGQDLAPEHGYPMRIFIPGKFGMKQPKWVTRLEFVDKRYLGYWETLGWSDSCERGAHARFSDLKNGATISGKSFEITGYALGNLDGIAAVDISFDRGSTWQRASIFSNPSPLVWTFWKYFWSHPKPGSYTLRVRATDGRGRAEEYDPRGIYPDGATGQQDLEIRVI